MSTLLLRSGALSLALSLFLPLHAPAFEFDVWRSGMSLPDVLATARDHDLPIAPSPLIHINKHYNHQIATKDAGKQHSYKYQTRLLGWPAAVTLHRNLSPPSSSLP